MGIQDFGAIFDVLDPACRGCLTDEQLHTFYEGLHFTPIDVNHVKAAIRYVYGPSSDGLVTKDKFLDVLQEIDRRRQVEDQARWDFQGLDRTGSFRISVPDALLLFRTTQGERFSMATWHKFLASRESQTQDISFDELRLWLCDLPTDSSADSELKTEEERIKDLLKDQTDKEHAAYRKAKEENETSQQKEENRMLAKRGARRKMNVWEKDGLEALLYDDGVDRGEYLPSSSSTKISVSELLDKLDVKYDLLRTKLFWEMINKESNNVLLSDIDQVDAFQRLQAQERQMRRDGILPQSAQNLAGGSVSQSVQLVGLMGGMGDQLNEVKNEVNEQRVELQGEGKDEAEVEKALRGNYERKIKGPVSSSDLLVALYDRWKAEREELLSRLRSAAPAASKLGQVLVEFSRLEWQEIGLNLEEEFQAAATATGLSERLQPYKYTRFDPDRLGQERLASDRLRQRKGRKLKPPPAAAGAPRGANTTELVSALVKEVYWKQAEEREVLVQLLVGRDAGGSKAAARQLSGPQRHHKRTSLRNQRLAWRSSNAHHRTTHKSQQIKILQEGVGLYYETTRSTLGGSDSAICAAVLADLQQTQDAEFQELLNGLYTKKEKELENLLVAESSSRTEEQLDTLARLLLGVFEVRDDEKSLLAALDAKYDALRHVLLLHAVREELGLAWTRLDSDERQRHLVKKKNDEQRFRQEGRFEEMAQLITKMPQNIGTIRQLMGEDREEFSRRQKMLAEKRDQAAVQGQDTSLVESDEAVLDQTNGSNILADLLQRYYVEQDFVIGWYRSSDSKARGQGYLNLPQVLLQIEKRMCEREECFDLGAITVGLTERIDAASERRHPSDRQRQVRLSTARVEARRQRVEKGLPRQKELDEYARPEKGDLVAWMESFLREQNKKHVEERELLLGVLQDAGLEELVEVARTMPPAERTSRLAELRVKRNKMDMENPSQREENYSIIEEAAAIRCVIKREKMETSRNDVSHRDIVVDLLTELQDEQDTEMSNYASKIHSMTYEELKKAREYEINARHWGSAENVILVLTRHEGEAEDDVLMAALNEKYDALRDKLLADLLMKQIGEAEWAKLSEQERQRRLMQLKLKEKRLRRDGNLDELSRLFGDNLLNEEALRKMMGDNRAEYDRKLQERLARRQKRIDEGLDPEDDEDLDEVDGGSATNLLEDLQARYEAEKEALLRQMRGLDAKHLSERERQAELLRLKREARHAEREDKFGNAARLIGLAERQQGELSEKLARDRERQEQLARERLEALRKRRGDKQSLPSEEVLREGTQGELQDAVMKRLDEKHLLERELLVKFLSNLDADTTLRTIAKAMSPLEQDEKLQGLKEKRINQGLESTMENHSILQEAVVIKSERRRFTWARKSDEDVTDDDITVSLLADLQQQQDKEAEATLNEVLDKDTEELIAMQVSIIEMTKQQRADNVAAILFAPEKEDEQNELLAALDSKYDALRDKLLIEALMKEAGEKEWEMLSEGERQRRLAELKLKERQLRRQGKHEDAAALLGDALKNHESLQALMGNNREEQERRIKERLERRKQRQAQGVSEEECERLEQEEIAAEEEEDKKRNNVLLDLMKNYDAERDALLKAMQDSMSKAERERLRQAELARLKREQRRAKTEQKYDAAAIVLGLAQKHQDSAEAERLRQEQLARERLAARQAARLARKGTAQEDSEEEVVAPTDDKDLAGLQDAILQETELKHKAEREVLLKILDEEAEGKHREAARALNAEQRLEKQEELRQWRTLWREQPDADKQLQDELLKEGAGLCLEITAERLASGGKDTSNDALQVALLANLQQSQEHEMRALANTMSKADAATLHEVKTVQAEARHRHLYDNVAVTVLGRDPLPDDDGLSAEEREAVGALQKKYDAARDKLLVEALMKEAGDREWAMLTEAERQRRLVRMRLQEKRLRREGKFDEAAALLGQNIKDQEALQAKLGESRSEQQRRLEERLKRRAELKAEREAKGESTDELLLDAMVDQEMAVEDEAKKKNVLESLQHHYEDEKEALLAALRSNQDREARERHRQLQMAKLRREQKVMAKEAKFDSAAILLSMAKQDEQRLEQKYTSEQERQKQLARERLAARRQRKAGAATGDETDQLKEAEEKLKMALESSSQDNDGELGLTTAVLEEMTNKHGDERNTLMDLLANVQSDPNIINAAKELGFDEAKMQLEQYRLDRVRWQKESRKASTRLTETGEVTDAEKANLQKTLEDGGKEQEKVLLQALGIKLHLEVEALRKEQPEMSEKDAIEEAGITLLADLQMKQSAEISAMENVLPEQGEVMLVKLKDTQHLSKTCGWYENLTSAICTLPSLDEPSDEPLPDQGAVVQTLEAELEKEKEEYIENLRKARPGEEIDVDAAMKELEAQQDAKRKALQNAMEQQKQQLKKRLAAKRRAKEAAEYEEETAVALVRNAEREHSFVLEKKQKEKARQQDLMAQRLAARRDARRIAQENESYTRESSDVFSDVMSDTSSRVNTPSLPGGRMRREKTALDVEVTEDQKKELFSQVVRENADWKRKISADQQRQQDQLQRRLRDRSNKRQEEADALFSLGMRQKTILEKTKQEERDRQITAMKERVARVRHERTMTMKDISDKKARKFDELVDQGAEGMTEDEKMALAAKRIESNFRDSKRDAPPTTTPDNKILEEEEEEEEGAAGGAPAPAAESAGKLLSKEEKMSILKQRRLEKKRQRQEQSQE